MRPTEVTESLRLCRAAKRPVLLFSAPGAGKSSVARQLAADEGVKFLDVRALLHDPSDLKFPIVDLKAKTVAWVQSIFPTDPEWEGVVCLEELDKAPVMMQGALLGAVLEHEVGGVPLPPGMWFVGCCNRAEDRAGSGKMITPLLSRFVCLDMETSNEDWQAWAIGAGIHPVVRSFNNYRPPLLHAFRPDSGDRSYPCPRTWHFVSDLMWKGMPDHLMGPLVSGCVGEGAAAEFVSFAQVWQHMPDLDVMISNPGTCTVPTEPSLCYAVGGALADKARTGDAKTRAAAGHIASRFSREFAAVIIRDLTAACGVEMLKVPQVRDWMSKNRSLIAS